MKHITYIRVLKRGKKGELGSELREVFTCPYISLRVVALFGVLLAKLVE